METKQMPPFTVAIVGAGISGLILALALQERNIPFSIYEQGHAYSHLGAGLSVNPAGTRALRASSQAAFKAFEAVRSLHHPTRQDFYFTYSDGENEFEVTTKDGFGSVRRSDWVQRLGDGIPSNSVHFRKRLQDLTESEEGMYNLIFEDGSTATADIVIGCDGIRSKVRSFVVGKDDRHGSSAFSHYVMFRSMMRKSDASRVIGKDLAEVAHIRSTKGIGYVSYPITGGELNSFGLFTYYPGEWPYFPSITAPTTKEKFLEGVSDPFVKQLVVLLEDEITMWAVYDQAEHPLPTYSKGRIAVLGDAGHSSTPFLGAGAGMCIEDVVILSELLSDCAEAHRVPMQGGSLVRDLERCLAAYSESRMPRSQWLVSTSRNVGATITRHPVNGEPWTSERFKDFILESYENAWGAQIDEMLDQARALYRKLSHDGSSMNPDPVG